MADPKKRKLKTFPGLDAVDFQHPHDVTATEALRQVPGLDTLIAKVLEYGFERSQGFANVPQHFQIRFARPFVHEYLLELDGDGAAAFRKPLMDETGLLTATLKGDVFAHIEMAPANLRLREVLDYHIYDVGPAVTIHG